MHVRCKACRFMDYVIPMLSPNSILGPRTFVPVQHGRFKGNPKPVAQELKNLFRVHQYLTCIKNTRHLSSFSKIVEDLPLPGQCCVGKCRLRNLVDEGRKHLLGIPNQYNCRHFIQEFPVKVHKMMSHIFYKKYGMVARAE